MKTLVDLKNAITHPEFLKNQFNEYSEKNILFINPQLSGKDLYRVFLPYFSLSETSATAIHHISNYNPKERIIGGKETDIEDYMIDWAHYIVFPFTTQPLVHGLYNRIRKRNALCKIIYLVDFNFYEMRPTHPFYDIFKDETTIKYVEDNMFYSDLVVVSNKELMGYLLKQLRTIIPIKYKNERTNMSLSCMPFMIDTELVLKNVDFTPEKFSLHKKDTIHTPAVQERINQTAKASNQVRQKKINKKNKSAKKHALKKQAKKTKNHDTAISGRSARGKNHRKK